MTENPTIDSTSPNAEVSSASDFTISSENPTQVSVITLETEKFSEPTQKQTEKSVEVLTESAESSENPLEDSQVFQNGDKSTNNTDYSTESSILQDTGLVVEPAAKSDQVPDNASAASPSEFTEVSKNSAHISSESTKSKEKIEGSGSASDTQNEAPEFSPNDNNSTPETSEGTPGELSAGPTEEEQNPTLAKFMTACQNGDLAVVEDLISEGHVTAHDTFSQGITGLHWAAINNRLSVVKYLIENNHSKADPNFLGGTLAASPLHWACRNGLVYVVDYLLTHTNADPTLKDSQHYNALHLAVHSSNITLVLYIIHKCVLIDKSIYIDMQDGIQCTALHWAAYQGDILSVKTLIKYGADVAKTDKSLMTPLHWAFIRGYKSVLAALLDAGSDIFHQNDKQKDSFGVAADMNCAETWTQVLKEADRNPKKNWTKNTHFLSQKHAKLVTFFIPSVTLPLVLQICSFSEGYVIPKIFFSALISGASVLFLQKVVIPVYLWKDKALFQTPFLAGLFSATAIWTVLSWFFVVLPKVLFHEFFTSLILAGLIATFTYSFLKAMTINPGIVPAPSDPKVVFEDMKNLLAVGQFDTEHFCVNTFTRKPLRSKFSKVTNALVARFDHYCPWVYNDIGVRNHKLFITFVYSLSAAIVLFTLSAIEYFDVYAEDNGYSSDVEDSCALLADEMCVGFTKQHFIFNLMVWCWFQGVWIAFLCIVQTFQIFKGLTTWEFSSLDKQMSTSQFNHSTVPGDFSNSQGNQGLSSHASHGHRRKNGLGTCMKLLGIDQFVKTLKVGSASVLKHTAHGDNYNSIESFEIPTDFGWKQNWLDFWFIGDIEWRNLFFLPIGGENNLNGIVVDYYKLYEYPAKATGAEAV